MRVARLAPALLNKMIDFNKRFSFPHFDGLKDESFYYLFKNSTQSYKDEIQDIYFGGEFLYTYKNKSYRFGETMGYSAKGKQLNNLFKIQKEFGVTISLTLNSLNIHHSLTDPKILDKFIKWLKIYYDKGLRSCTISSTHLMRTEKLQNAFPEMHWKNTVNHQVKSVQEVYDYAALGYNTILLDRSLNRDIDTLKSIKPEAKKLGVLTSLLAVEGCMPSCPFKIEHDTWQHNLQNSSKDYWSTFSNTCTQWRKGDFLPREGTNISMATKEIADEFFNTVDILKFSGRLQIPNFSPYYQFAWVGEPLNNKYSITFYDRDIERYDCFKDIYKDNLIPFLGDRWSHSGFVDKNNSNINKAYKYTEKDSIWLTKKGKNLSKILMNCKNQCWDCHACEKVFNIKPYNSILEV